MLTAKCMAVVFLAGYLIGVPLVWLARRGKPPTATDWLYAPFVGLGVATLVTHQLAYLDVRIAWSAPAIWIAVGLLWLGLGSRYGCRTPFQNCPWPVLVASLLVYLVHGLGLVVNGTDGYVGRYHTDRFNYTAVAQFLIDLPFSVDWHDLGQRAYLSDGLKLVKWERIGAEAYLGFLSVSAGATPSRMFEAVIVSGPALLVPALVLVGRALAFSWPHALLAGTAGGLLPGLATLHTLGFLANVSGIPFLIASAAATAALVAGPTPRRVGVAGLLYASTACLYTEFTPVLGAIAGGGLAFRAVLSRCWSWRVAGAVLAAGLLAVAVFPKSSHAGDARTLSGTTRSTPKVHPVSWVQGEPTAGAVWVYDAWSVEPPVSRRRLVTGIGGVLSALAAAGLVRLLFGALASRCPRPDGSETPAAGVGVMGLLVACLAAGPLVLFADGEYDYQAMKLLLSLSPLWAIGLAAALRPREAEPGAAVERWRGWHRAALAGLLVPVVVSAYGTGALPCTS